MLRRVHIRNFKSLRDVEVELKPLTAIFGPNASGKSNFLDALQILAAVAGARSLREGFAPPYRGKPLESFSFGPGGIRELLGKDSASFSIEADVELSEASVKHVEDRIREARRGADHEGGRSVDPIREKVLRYRVEIEIIPASGTLRVADEYLAGLNEKGKPTGRRNPFVERVENRIHVRMEGQSHPTYHERFLDHTILSRPHYPPHHPHLVALQAEFASFRFFYFEPRERMREANPVKEVRHLGLMGEDLAAFLNTLKALDPRQFRAIERALRMYIPGITAIELAVNAMGEVELGVREGDVVIPSRLLSEGTLRLLGMLALSGAKEPPSVVGFEEPENGLHPRRIGLVAEYLKGRAEAGRSQMIVTTHSPLLADALPEESLYCCRRGVEGTEISPLGSWGAIGRRSEIDVALEEMAGLPEESTLVSERLLRGDFDA